MADQLWFMTHIREEEELQICDITFCTVPLQHLCDSVTIILTFIIIIIIMSE